MSATKSLFSVLALALALMAATTGAALAAEAPPSGLPTTPPPSGSLPLPPAPPSVPQDVRPPGRCVVPSLVGTKLVVARRRLTSAGCALGVVNRMLGVPSKRGRVLKQLTVRGKLVPAGTRVALVVGR